jgi:hypothetical protein
VGLGFVFVVEATNVCCCELWWYQMAVFGRSAVCGSTVPRSYVYCSQKAIKCFPFIQVLCKFRNGTSAPTAFTVCSTVVSGSFHTPDRGPLLVHRWFHCFSKYSECRTWLMTAWRLIYTCHALPMPCPCRSHVVPLVMPCRVNSTCHAVPLPFSDSFPVLRESPRGSRKYPNC